MSEANCAACCGRNAFGGIRPSAYSALHPLTAIRD